MTNRESFFVRRFLREKASNAYLRQGPWYIRVRVQSEQPTS